MEYENAVVVDHEQVVEIIKENGMQTFDFMEMVFQMR